MSDQEEKRKKAQEKWRKWQEEREARQRLLVERVVSHLDEAKALKEKLDRDWGVADNFYRFYHQSFKVYRSQSSTEECLELFKKIAQDDFKLDRYYLQILEDGTGKEFDLSHNQEWLKHTRPIVEAMLHSKFFLDLIVEHGEKLKDVAEPPRLLDSGWAAVLYLFSER